VAIDSLTYVGSTINIQANGALTSFSLAALTEVDGDVYIYNNSSLSSLSFNSLAYINGYFWVNANNALSYLALDSLTNTTSFFALYESPSYCQSQAEAWVAQMEAAGWSGTTYVYSNASC